MQPSRIVLIPLDAPFLVFTLMRTRSSVDNSTAMNNFSAASAQYLDKLDKIYQEPCLCTMLYVLSFRFFVGVNQGNIYS